MPEPGRKIKNIFLTINHNITTVQEECFSITFEGCRARGQVLTSESWEDAEVKARSANPKRKVCLSGELGKPRKIR